MKIRALLTAIAMLVAGAIEIHSQNMNKPETPQSVVANVHKAVEILKSQGSAALPELCDPKSEFNNRDAYLFIIDVESSLVVSNPRFPERTGGNIREHLDWAGKQYGIELCKVAMNGGGWIEFVWPKPGTNEGVRKISYICPVAGMRYTVCAGIYDDTTTLDELNAMTGTGSKDSKVAVIFEVTPTEDGISDYFRLGAALKDELSKVPGFISVERFESVNNPGKYLSLSFWENENAASLWRNQTQHRQSQKAGHDSLFKKYRISVGKIIREYTDRDRLEAPTDSNAYLSE